MRGDQIGLHQRACIATLRQQVDMHLVGAAFGALVAEMGEIEGRRVVLSLAEGERDFAKSAAADASLAPSP